MTSQWDYDDVTIGPEDNQVRRTVNVLVTMVTRSVKQWITLKQALSPRKSAVRRPMKQWPPPPPPPLYPYEQNDVK